MPDGCARDYNSVMFIANQMRLPLNAGTDDFAGFYAPCNALLVEQLQGLAKGKPGVITFDGPAGSGKSHLLRATAAATRQQRRTAAYVFLAQHPQPPGWLTARSAAVICIDDLQLAARRTAWQLPLLALYEAQRSSGGGLALAADAPLKQLRLNPPDLLSRLLSGQHYALLPLDEPGQRAALTHSARLRGFTLPPAALDYICTRCARDTASLFALLGRIERQAITRGKPVTLALVRGLCA